MSGHGNTWIPLGGLIAGLVLTACTGPMAPGRKMDTRLFPLYSSASNDEGDSYGYTALFQLLKHDRTPEQSYTHVIPFYFHSDAADGSLFTLVPPFYYHRKDLLEEDLFFLLTGAVQRGWRIDRYALFPLIRYTHFQGAPERMEAYLFPLVNFVKDEGRNHLKVLDLLGLFNLLDWEWGIPKRDGSTGHAFSFLNILGLVQLAGSGNAGGYKDLHFLTLFSSEKLSLFQRHWKESEGGGGRTILFPFYWHLKNEERETVQLWPLLGWSSSRDGAWSKHVLYPFFEYEGHDEKDEWAIDCPWPLVRVMRGEDGNHENRLLPFYWDRDIDGRRLWSLFPFYARYENDAGYSRQFFTPLVSTFKDEAKEGSGLDLVYPLISHQQYGDKSHHRFFPLYHLTLEENTHFMEITPLFWSYRNEEAYAFDLLFPLYAYFGYGEEDSTYSLLPIFKVIADRPRSEQKGRFQFDFLWPIAGYGHHEERRIAWLFPLFNHVRDKSRDQIQWGFLADIFDFKVERSRKTFTFLWFIPISWGGQDDFDSEE